MKSHFAVLVLLFAGTTLAAQTSNARSYGVSVQTATVNQQTPAASLPTDGSVGQSQVSDVAVPSFVTAQDAFATASGASDGSLSDAVSSATLGTVSILDGLITADGVVAMASS